MRVVSHPDPGAYAERVRPLLRRDEALHNLPLGVLGQIEDGVYGEWTLLTVEGGGVAGLALRTPPWPWAVACFTDDVDAFTACLGDHLARVAPLPGEVTGERGVAAAVADRWAVAADAVASVGMAMRIMGCTGLVEQQEVPGAPRRVQVDDLELVVRWLVSFELETGASREPREPTELRSLLAMSVEEQRSPLWLWEDDGEVVSLAGIGRPTGSGERIGPVYTPPELRGRGYAGALVSHLTRDAFDRGCSTCSSSPTPPTPSATACTSASATTTSPTPPATTSPSPEPHPLHRAHVRSWTHASTDAP